jgi:FkbM family methyltransferase
MNLKNWYLRKVLNHLIKVSKNEQGSKKYQWFFHQLQFNGVLGMNHGNSDPESNGEYFLLNNLSNKLKSQEIVIFDVGANIGDYAKKISSVFKHSKIYCFEPSAKTFETLKQNTQNCNQIVYENLGIGETKKEITLYKDSDNSALASIFQRNLDRYGVNLNVSEIIKITTLDAYCDHNKIHQIDFLKLDIEGNELNAFKGAKKMLSEKRIKNIQFEMGGCNIDSKTFWQDIYYYLSPNYKIFRILNDGVVEFEKYNEFQEISVYANYFAECR